MRPDHDPPRPHLVRPIDWAWEEHPDHGRIVRLWSPSNQAWSKQLAWTGLVHEGLERGESFDLLVASVAEAFPAKSLDESRSKVGTYLYMLMVEGYVGMDFPPPPERFAPHLETQKALGRGGVGVAWLCRDTANARNVVVKHAWDYFQPIDYTDRLMRDETKVLAALDHPGILRLFETFERDGLLHMVREYVDGAPLMAERPTDPDAQRAAARDILDIIAHLHERGHLILDLRPANFFRRQKDDRIVLVDVGSCVAHEDGAAKVKKGIGTPGFTAPEVRKRGRATTAAVLYGYGRLLFQIAAGRRPLKEWDREELLDHVGDHVLAPLIAATTHAEPEARASFDELEALLR